MTHASLFSGIGGPEVAAAMLGWDNAFHCEINPFGRAVLDYWFPDSASYEDIKTTDFTPWRGKVDVLTGGFPCQPFSYAGKRGGRDDDRYLWPEMLRAIDEIRPSWVIGENVAGITTMVEGGVLADLGGEATLFGEGDGVHRYALRQSFTLERICRDLERLGYSVQPLIIPAAGVGAPHRRDRVFVIAYDDNADRRYDKGGAGTYEGEGEGEGIQERDLLREPRKSGGLRSEILRDAQDPVQLGREGRLAELGHQPGPGDTRPASSDGETRRIASDPDSSGREEPVLAGRGTDCPEDGGRLYDRVERSGGDGTSSYAPGRGGRTLPEQVHPRVADGDQPLRDGCGGDAAGAGPDWAIFGGLLPENRWKHFPTVSPIHRGNDGLPFPLDNLAIPQTKWRTESLKAYGNAIVPQVMYEIFRCLEEISR